MITSTSTDHVALPFESKESVNDGFNHSHQAPALGCLRIGYGSSGEVVMSYCRC